MRSDPRTARKRAPGVIKPGHVYTLAEFLKITDCGDTAWRKLRRLFPHRRVGRRVFILGDDFIAYLEGIEPEPIEPRIERDPISEPPHRASREATTANRHGITEDIGAADVSSA